MYRLEKEFRFEAAHRLPDHDGKCRRLHGHSWRGWLVVEGDVLHVRGPKRGMLVDYGDLKRALASVLETSLDHHDLNETVPYDPPTSENVARWIYDVLRDVVPGLAAIVIEETCTSRVEYRP